MYVKTRKRILGYLSTLTGSVLIGISLFSCSQEVSFGPGEKNSSSQSPFDDERKEPGSNSPGTIHEKFTVDDPDAERSVDVLFVIDNSTSMRQEQQKLGERLSSFIDKLENVDWQIGVTTTDISRGPYGLKGQMLNFSGTNSHVLHKGVANYENKFLKTVVRKETNDCVQLGATVCPSGDERPLAASILAMEKKDSVNQGFFREKSDLAIVIVTDEDEGSSGGPNVTQPKDVIEANKYYLGSSKDLTAYAIVIQPGDTNCFDAQNGGGGFNFGVHAHNLAMKTDGISGSICKDDYGPTLESIGENLAEQIKALKLKEEPDPDTLKVTFTPDDPNIEWKLRGRSIRFKTSPRPNTLVKVSYKAIE